MVNSDLRRIVGLPLKHKKDISNLFKRDGGVLKILFETKSQYRSFKLKDEHSGDD